MSNRITLSLDQEAEHLQNKLEKEIENVYGGKSAFYRNALSQYDEKSRYEAKLAMIQDRMDALKDEMEELELMKKATEEKLDQVKVEKKQEIDEIEVDSQFWDKTVEMIFKRKTTDDPETLRKRYNKWFDGRHQVFCNRYKEISVKEFQRRLIQEAEERDMEHQKIQKLEDKIGVTA